MTSPCQPVILGVSVLKCRLFAARERFTASVRAEMRLPPTSRFSASECDIFKRPTLEKGVPGVDGPLTLVWDNKGIRQDASGRATDVHPVLR